METTRITLISASDGHYLTEAKEVDNRTFSLNIYLGDGDSAGNYKEVTREEKEAYEAAHQPQQPTV